jgi:aspartate racemase
MKAIILAAGRGTRLRPFTDSQPKCMVPVGSEPLLASALSALASQGVSRAVLVVGHMEHAVRAAYGSRFGSMELTYVSNPNYEATSNLFSLWLAREELDEDLLLIEGDLRFEPELLRRLVQHPAPNVAVVDEYAPHMNGTVILADGDRAARLVLGRDQRPGFDYGDALKTVNMYKLGRQALAEAIVPALDARVAHGDQDSYYEAVFGDLLCAGRLELAALRAGGLRWAELDTEADRRRAEAIFGHTQAQEARPVNSLVVGVLGGMGSYSTLHFFERLLDAFPGEKEWDRPRVIIDNNCILPSRVRALLYGERREELVSGMAESMRKLLAYGPHVIVMPCHTAHSFRPEVQVALGVHDDRILDMVGATVEHCAGERDEVLLLATEGTVASGVYERYCAACGVQLRYPEAPQQARVREFIEQVKQRRAADPEGFASFLDELDARTVVLGCTELSVLHGASGQVRPRVVDPLDVVVSRVRAMATDVATPGAAPLAGL